MSSMEKPAVPVHVALIMDGNGRWAEKKHLPRTSGHKEGLTAAKDIMGAAADIGIQYVTLYAFSTENWKRTEAEVGYLMSLISIHLRAELDFYRQKGIRVKHIGDLEGLPANVRKEIIRAQEDTASFTGTTLVLAINYGGRDEIIRGIKKYASSGSAENLTEKNFLRFLMCRTCRTLICLFAPAANSGSVIFCCGTRRMRNLFLPIRCGRITIGKSF